jgi:hypothetical protein
VSPLAEAFFELATSNETSCKLRAVLGMTQAENPPRVSVREFRRPQ